AANVGEQRDSPDEQQEKEQANRAVDQVEDDLAAQRGIRLLQFRSRQQRQVFVHEDEEGQRDDDVDCGQPSADSGGFFAGLRLGGFFRGGFRLASLRRDGRGGRLPMSRGGLGALHH